MQPVKKEKKEKGDVASGSRNIRTPYSGESPNPHALLTAN